MYTANKIRTSHPAHRRGYESSQRHLIFCLLITALLCLTAASNTASAATYYVDAQGTSGGSGTSDDPYHRQGNEILNLGQPGDVVCLQDGYYGEIDTSALSNSDYITIQAQPGHTPTFKRIKLRSGSKWIFRGLTISPEFAPVFEKFENPKYGMFEIWNTQNIIIENNNIFSVQDASSWTANDWNSLASRGIHTRSSPNVIIRNNTIKNVNYGIGILWGHGTLIEYNKVEHNIGDGIQVYATSDVTVQYNTLKNFYSVSSLHMDGIQFYTLPGDLPCDNAILRGNIIIHQDPNITKFTGDLQGIGCFDPPYNNWLVENNVVIVPHLHGIALYGATDSRIINNIAFHPNPTFSSGVQIHTGFGTSSNTVIRNNMANVINTAGTNITADHNIDIDDFGPDVLFVDYLNNDLRHKSGSPAIDAGSPDLAPATDILGVSRVFPPDAGCYEYIPSGPPDTTAPSTPQNLTAQVISESQINLSWEESNDPESGVSYYKIYRDNNEIDTSVLTSYSNTGLDSGTTYSYEVSAVNGAALESNRSNTAEATTFSDTTAPSIVSVSASENSVEIVFSEPLDTMSAEDINNYSITGGISVSVTAASLDTDTVTLTTSAHTEGTYILTVEYVQDTSGNPMTETTTDYQYNNGLAGYWKFDDGDGISTLDSSGNSNTGTLINGPAWTGQGELSFDGVNDYVKCGTNPSLNLTGSLTISAWINPQSFGQNGWGRIVDKGDASTGYSFFVNETSNGIGYVIYGGDVVASNSQVIELNTWQHVTIVYNESSSTVTFYVDSQEAGTTNYTTPPLDSSNDSLVIGIRGYDLNRAFDGLIDEVRVYNRALTADEVSNLALVFLPIDDKEVEEDSTLTFEVRTQDPNQEVLIESHNLPSDPNFFSNIFAWTPQYGDAGSYEVTFVAPHGEFEDYEKITIRVNESEIVRPVYRFWSPTNSRHFYTIKEAEKDKLINIYAHVWTYESIAYYAFAEDSEPGLVPVYRFWSPVLVAHFYTISESERDKLINIYPHVWTYESVAFYAYPEGQQPQEAKPVYRFWSGTLGTHFYTISESEKNKLVDNYSHVWTYESTAWYAYTSY